MAFNIVDVETWFVNFDRLSDGSPDLQLLRPVILSEAHLSLLNDCNRECKICCIDLNEDSVQQICCRSMYHRDCLVSYVSHQPSESKHTCPWCRTKLEAFNHDILAHLSSPAKYFQRIITRATNHLISLQTLPGLTRVRFVQYVEALVHYRDKPKSVTRWIRMEALEREFMRPCIIPFHPYCSIACHLLDHLQETYGLLLWFATLINGQDIISAPNLADAPTRYGNGPDMFEPLITETMKVQQHDILREPKKLKQIPHKSSV